MNNSKVQLLKKPLFSIIMPTFNRARSLMTAIQSLQAQNLNSWELIIVDDGSTDDTDDVVHKLAENDPRIRLVTKKNEGTALARNSGIHEACGEFLAFLDSDDTLCPEHLELRLRVFSTMNIDLIYGPANIIGDSLVVDRSDPTKLISLNDISVKICGTFSIRTADARRIGGFSNIKYSEDGEFFARAQAFGLKTFRLRLKTYNYDRTTSDSICTQVLDSIKQKRTS